MDGISGVTSRIAEIQALIGSLQPPAPATTTFSSTAPGTGTGGATGSAFASTLSQSIAARSTTGGLLTGAGPAPGTASAGAGAPSTAGLRNADGVPLELVKYGNGKVPAAALSSIGQGSHKLWAPAAQAYQQLRAAAARDGVTIKATDSYRSYEQQVELAQRKGLYSQGGLAARPGTSEHGWGLSLDLDLDTEALNWMRTHAEEHGFSENVPREPWHWTFTA
ncbi:M15 family metallopeptidase [Kineococcus esterisolvens]|uniref:M15 family metallopeptidase n=1 Tax=unclassified Kineococcus TaxID=2621656 RepID=UPI003D7D7C58